MTKLFQDFKQQNIFGQNHNVKKKIIIFIFGIIFLIPKAYIFPKT